MMNHVHTSIADNGQGALASLLSLEALFANSSWHLQALASCSACNSYTIHSRCGLELCDAVLARLSKWQDASCRDVISAFRHPKLINLAARELSAIFMQAFWPRMVHATECVRRTRGANEAR